jgi:NitT/TauT family transport system substrate-binding protein
VLARDQGFDVKGIGGVSIEKRGEPTHAILVRADSPIREARDLGGKTMATNTLNNIDHIMQQTWIQDHGADPKRVSFVELPFPQHPAALAQSRVDAIGPSEPFVAVAESQGARVLAYHYTDTNPSTLIAYYTATGDWLKNNPDVAQRFARVLRRADEYLTANLEERRAAGVKFLNLSPDVVGKVKFEELAAKIDPAEIQWWIDAGRKFGLVNTQLNPQDFIYDTAR